MSEDVTGSEMSSSVNSDASYDIDIVRHHDGESLAWSVECPLVLQKVPSEGSYY